MKIGQSRLMSFVESLLNVLIGFTISVIANLIVLPWWGYDVSPRTAIEIGVVFTFISIARSYFIRRLFNFLHIRRPA